ncbi:MAG: sigma-54-dependent Fis family transcriptional regulator [Acidobacteria bacterium]|nr:sigma-54-dependent Fis family transcriptional regulator [Acidobacteriota bacterium]
MFNAEELTLLYMVARALLEERDYGELLAAVLDRTIESLGADRGFVLVREDGGFRAAVSRNFRSEALSETEEEVSNSIAGEVLESGKALLIGNALESERFKSKPSVRRMAIRSVLCAPLVATTEAFAMIYLENRDIANRFTERQRELLDEICGLAAPRLRTAVAIEDAKRRARRLESAYGETDGIRTADERMFEVLRTVRQVAPTDLSVLIQGETGTGKELIARALYRQSVRSNGPFVVVNCAALPATLIESELFGAARGAFTGATRDRLGLVGAAHRGTLFLDEVGELPLELQPRLLRVLQSGEYTRLGATRTETADVRVISATNRDLDREIEAGRFRSDLYYRLAGITLNVPPLRERPQDIHLLADHYLREYAARYGRVDLRLGPDLLGTMLGYSFPGNVRELEAEMARLVAVSTPGALLGAGALSERIRGAASASPASLQPMSIAEMEKRLIVMVLKSTDGNRTRAAELLGISREGLRTKMQRYGLSEGS